MKIHLKPCPFCGFEPDYDDIDCCYPIALDEKTATFSLYGLHCYSTGGGCGAQVIGESPKECIKIWNGRMDMNDYLDIEKQKKVMIEYMQVMIAREDWHGVADAAMDLRDMSLEQEMMKRMENNEIL